jgi:hypothetical protein
MPIGDIVEKANAKGRMLAYIYKENVAGKSLVISHGREAKQDVKLPDGTD